MQAGLSVHGSIFFLLKKFIDHSFGLGHWEDILKESKVLHADFDLTKAYPIQEIGSIITTVSGRTGRSSNDLKEAFGIYLVPDLFQLYGSYLKPEWKTLDVVEHTERVMHGAVRKLNSSASPPILNVTRINPDKLMVDYYSKRRMGALAVGIIKGIAKYYKEDHEIVVTATSNPNDERVQLIVERISG
jgi:hypothetical protein